jgi:hypothetical protein
MPGMTHGADGQASAHRSGAQPVNCAHLHSAFGPGCPYCGRAVAAPVATATSSIHAPLPDPADVGMAYHRADGRDLDKIIHPGREPDLGAVA